MKTGRTQGILAAIAALLGTAAHFDGPAHKRGGGVGTLRRGETKRAVKPQWLQDRLIARAAEKRARKANARLQRVA